MLTELPTIKVVGLSAAGKSTLVAGLRAAGYQARPVSQEHSAVSTLWQEFGPTHTLVYLHVTLEAQRARRPDVAWTEEAHRVEMERLRHAADHADLSIDTSAMSADQVCAVALAYLRHHRVRHAGGPLPPVAATGSAARKAGPEPGQQISH